MNEAKRTVKNRPDWLTKAVLKADEIPPGRVQRDLVNTAMNTRVEGVDFWIIGKRLQVQNPGVIPFKTEYEVAAGYWYWLRGELGLNQKENTSETG